MSIKREVWLSDRDLEILVPALRARIRKLEEARDDGRIVGLGITGAKDLLARVRAEQDDREVPK